MKRLIWCDIETTGLDPNIHSILEVAFAEADLDDPFNIKLIYNSVFWFNPKILKGRHKDIDPFVIEMHTKNNLWNECGNKTKAISILEAENELLNLIQPAMNNKDLAILAGSSIHFDHSFLKIYMPRLSSRFSHRHYDVSSIKLFCMSLGMNEFPKTDAHRAIDDVFESAKHGQKCAEWLKHHS